MIILGLCNISFMDKAMQCNVDIMLSLCTLPEQPYLESLFVFDQFSGLLSSALVCHNNIAGLHPPRLFCIEPYLSISRPKWKWRIWWMLLGVFGKLWIKCIKKIRTNTRWHPSSCFIPLHKMVTFVKKDIVKESMKYNKGLTSKPEPFKCIEASTEVGIFLIHLERSKSE